MTIAVIASWTPVALLVAAALAPPLRIPALLALAAGAALVLQRTRGGAPGGPGVAWVAALPIAVSLVVGLLPDPRVADPGSCDDLLAHPVVRRVLQAGLVLGTVGILATRLGGRRSLGIVLPKDRRVIALVALAL